MLVSINLDGTGVCTSNSKIPFLDHMMDVRPLSASACVLSYLLALGVAALIILCVLCVATFPWPQQLASHGLFNVIVEADGDTWIDDHHTNEDIGASLQLTSSACIVTCSCA